MAPIPKIWRAMMVRPQAPKGGPQPGVLQVLLYHTDDSPGLLPKPPEGVRVKLNFADGLGSEVWQEQRRRLVHGTILTLVLKTWRELSLGGELLTSCAKPEILQVLAGFSLLVPNLPELRFTREPHPESIVFLPEAQTSLGVQPPKEKPP
ncbi:hypothetical protein HYW17_03080 [Candidatus Uhrbacteria bacterium]|nr:hypothetical protein [Candidatus Uhrbacteria bacterium]